MSSVTTEIEIKGPTFPILKDVIKRLQDLLVNAGLKNSEISEDHDFIIQEQLDNLEYYIKCMPKDKSILFRSFSDALYFSQSKYLEIKNTLSFFMMKYSDQISKCFKDGDDSSELNSSDTKLDIVSDMIFLCQIYQRNLKILYYDKKFSIKTEMFSLDPSYKFINLSLLTPGKVETFYTKDYISKAGMCQKFLYESIDKMFKTGDMDESLDDTSYHVYQNVEFVRWKDDQKKTKDTTNSFLSSLNESRDDSIDSSLHLSKNRLSKISDISSDWNSQSNLEYLDQVPSSLDGMSDVPTVFKMGSEKFMGSEKHYMSENIEMSMTNTNRDGQSSAADENEPKRRIKRVNRRKDGFVRLEYTGQGSVPLKNPQNKLKSSKRPYGGAISYTGPKKEPMMSESEIINATKNKKLHDYHKKDPDEKDGGIPLNSMDEKDNRANDSADSQPLSFFAAMEKSEKNEVYSNLKKINKIKEGGSNMKQELETIEEEKTKNEATMESKTINTTNEDNKVMGKSSEIKLDNSQKLVDSVHNNKNNDSSTNDLSMNYPYPADGILRDLHKEDLIKKLISETTNKSGMSNSNLGNTNLSYQQVLQMTNKTIPPIMKNLFNDSAQEHQHYSYANHNIPYGGYYAPPMPYQMPYQMPYPNMQQMNAMPPTQQQTQVQPEMTPKEVNPETPTSASSGAQKVSETINTQMQAPDKTASVNNTQYSTHQMPMQYPMQMPYYPNQMPQQYYPYQYPPQMPYNMPPVHPYAYQGQMMMPNNQYMPYQYPSYAPPPMYMQDQTQSYAHQPPPMDNMSQMTAQTQQQQQPQYQMPAQQQQQPQNPGPMPTQSYIGDQQVPTQQTNGHK